MAFLLRQLMAYRTVLLLISVVLLLALLQPLSGDYLRFDRQAIAQGQWWRLLSGHWVHLSWTHAFSNSAGLLLCAYIAGDNFNQRTNLHFLLFSLAFVGCGLWWWAPDLYRYVGMSGCLHGLLLVSVVRSRYYATPLKALIVLVIAGKVLWEQTPYYDDQALKALIGGRVETRAHLLGFISGLLWLAVASIISAIKGRYERRM